MLYKIKVVFKIGAHVLPSLACEIVTWCPRGVLLGTWYSNTNTWFISILNFSSTFKTVIPMLLDAKEYENELLSFIKISIIHTFKMLKRLLWFVGFWRVLCLFWSAKCGITSRNLKNNPWIQGFEMYEATALKRKRSWNNLKVWCMVTKFSLV